MDERHAYCPDILAAYLEVVNQTSGFGLVQSIPTGEISISTSPFCASALLKIQQTTYDLYASHNTTTLTRNLREILLGGKNGADTTVAALELLPNLWKISSTSDTTLSELCGFYIDTCLSTNESGPRAAALQNLAPIMDHLLSKKRFDLLEPSALQVVWKLLSLRSMSPSVSNALLRVSGCVVAVMNQTKQLSTAGLEGWGYMMASAGQDDEVCVYGSHTIRWICRINLKTGFRYSICSRRVAPVLLRRHAGCMHLRSPSSSFDRPIRRPKRR